MYLSNFGGGLCHGPLLASGKQWLCIGVSHLQAHAILSPVSAEHKNITWSFAQKFVTQMREEREREREREKERERKREREREKTKKNTYMYIYVICLQPMRCNSHRKQITRAMLKSCRSHDYPSGRLQPESERDMITLQGGRGPVK